jgi:surfeit locus 1 family protein
MFSRRWFWKTIIVLVATTVMIRLGIWQLERMDQRKESNAHVADMLSAPKLFLSEGILIEDLMDMEYRSVQAVGTYDFENQVAIRNQVWTQSWGDELGFALLTPLMLDENIAVLVERGWVPPEFNTPDSWRRFDEAGQITVTGIVRLPRKEGDMGGGVPDPTLSPGQERLEFWNFVNIERIDRQMPISLLPVYIQQAPDGVDDVLPFNILPVLDLTPGTHLGFALQWFTFATIVFLGYPFFLRNQKD